MPRKTFSVVESGMLHDPAPTFSDPLNALWTAMVVQSEMPPNETGRGELRYGKQVPAAAGSVTKGVGQPMDVSLEQRQLPSSQLCVTVHEAQSGVEQLTFT
jgi:hypothetical protein